MNTDVKTKHELMISHELVDLGDVAQVTKGPAGRATENVWNPRGGW